MSRLNLDSLAVPIRTDLISCSSGLLSVDRGRPSVFDTHLEQATRTVDPAPCDDSRSAAEPEPPRTSQPQDRSDSRPRHSAIRRQTDLTRLPPAPTTNPRINRQTLPPSPLATRVPGRHPAPRRPKVTRTGNSRKRITTKTRIGRRLPKTDRPRPDRPPRPIVSRNRRRKARWRRPRPRAIRPSRRCWRNRRLRNHPSRAATRSRANRPRSSLPRPAPRPPRPLRTGFRLTPRPGPSGPRRHRRSGTPAQRAIDAFGPARFRRSK